MSDAKYLKTLDISTRKNKKYMINVNGKWIHFGDKRHEQYKDSTPLRVYSYLDHKDPVRRARYYMRHGFTTNKNSAKYWSNKYLW